MTKRWSVGPFTHFIADENGPWVSAKDHLEEVHALTRPIELPTYESVCDKYDAGVTLDPVEDFVRKHEPIEPDDATFRAELLALIDFVRQHREV